MKKGITFILLAASIALVSCSGHTCPTYMKNTPKVVKNQDARV